MDKKVFFTDLDDTLLNRKKEITPDNQAAIQEALTRGHAMVITTGRALPAARKQAASLGLTGDNCYIISYNGSVIYDCTREKIIYQTGLPLDIVRICFDEAHKCAMPIQTYSEEDVLAERDTAVLRKYCQIQSLPFRITGDVIAYLKEAGLSSVPKVLAFNYGDPASVSAYRNRITPLMGDKADIFLSHDDMMEIVPPGVNKGAAVAFLCQYLDLPIEASVAAGDAENDLSMIQAAHIGCAMVNGEEMVKAAADYVTQRDCDHDGVAEILHRFVL